MSASMKCALHTPSDVERVLALETDHGAKDGSGCAFSGPATTAATAPPARNKYGERALRRVS